MSDILSQEEIEALLNSLSQEDTPAPSGGSEPPAASVGAGQSGSGFGGFMPAAKPGGQGTVAYEVYDFRRPDKFSKEQLRTLQMLHETFGRVAATSLSAYLRSPVSIDLISLEQVPYEEYLRSINKSVFTIMALPPLSGEAALEMEFDLIFTMIDRLLGGPGRTINRTSLTDIEQPLVRQIVDRIFQSLKASWEGVVVVNPAIEGIETSGQFVQIAPPSDIVVSILFEVRVADMRGAMSLCIPYMVLKPITTKLSAQKWFAASSARKQSPASRRALNVMIQDAEVDCAVLLGRSRIHISDFLRLRPGDVIRLDQKEEKDISFLIGGLPKYEGRPALDGHKLVFNVVRPATQR